ncbi:MAG: Ala-tRNA(Pro) deacylase [Thermoleophilaceae bacterium]|jgi:Ala-tRNA(Pro) deacylase|nr:Ala-tRNA(Pro) deacylase [Thermoleophilaceae bacterium]
MLRAPSPGAGARGFAAVRRCLDEGGVQYRIDHHEPTHTALAEAHASGVPLERMVKTVALRTGRGYVAVALPASERLDMARVRDLVGDPHARLAFEEELSLEFPALEPGALPPFGEAGPPLELVDRRVLASNWVLVNAGDQCHSLRMSPLEIVRLARARVVDVCRRGSSNY